MKLKELAQAIGAELVGGAGESEVLGVAGLNDAAPGYVSYVVDAPRGPPISIGRPSPCCAPPTLASPSPAPSPCSLPPPASPPASIRRPRSARACKSGKGRRWPPSPSSAAG
jgi:hypothetical protein